MASIPGDTIGRETPRCGLLPWTRFYRSRKIRVASDRSQVMAATSHFHFDRRIQLVVVNSQELAAMKQEERAFYAQVKRGIVLWETIDELAS